MKHITLVATLLLSAGAAAYASPTAEFLLTEPPPQSAKLNEIFNFRAKDGYHFNKEAPQACGAGEAFDVSSASLKCQFTQSGEQAVSLKLCAEKNPLCLFEEFTVIVEGSGRAVKKESAGSAREPETPLPGFILNEPEAALRQAVKENKPLFIDFFAKWCPSCRLMEDTSLIHPAFAEASGGMVRLSLDVDMPASREWLSRFRISSYPTFVVADSSLREIGRLEGSLSPEAFALWAREQQGWKDSPIDAAKAAVAALDEAGKLRVVKADMAGKDWAAARALLQGLKTPRREYLLELCRISEAEASGSKELAGLYQEALRRFDGAGGRDAEIGVIDWIAALHKLDSAAAKPRVDGLDALAARLVSSRSVIEEGYVPSEVYVALGDVMGGAGLEAQSLDFYGRAAAEYSAMAGKAAKPEFAKGLRMCHARYLALARRYEEAAAAYAALSAAFPGEYAFHRSYAGTLRKLKKYPEALRETELSSGLAYGDIKLDILLMKAEIEMEQKNRVQALVTLNAAIASVELPGDAKLRTHGAYRRLKNYRKEVEGSK